MKYATASAFRRALEDRIKMSVKREGIDLQRLRKQVAFDRFLARLFMNPNAPWILKGGYAMELRMKEARATKDIDLTLRNNHDHLKHFSKQVIFDKLQESIDHETGDFFIFSIGQPIRNLDNAPYGGARYPVDARMDGRSFAKFHIDVSMGDGILEPIEIIHGRDWLHFAGIPKESFPAISKEQQFSEKLHAYTLHRPRPNSRVRDIVDIVLLIQSGKMDKGKVREAIIKTFKKRKTHGVPLKLNPPSQSWEKPFMSMARQCGLTTDLNLAFQLLQSYLC